MTSIARSIVVAVLLLAAAMTATASEVPKSKQTKLGKYLTAQETFEIMKSEPNKTLFVDVRTRSELMFVGMTDIVDGHVAFVELNEFGEWDDKNNRFKLEANPAFSQGVERLLTAKGLTKSDRVILMCRSGDRSARGVNALAEAGFTNVFNQLEGFEGDLSKEGRRTVNGWKNSSLPWSYNLPKDKVLFGRAAQ